MGEGGTPLNKYEEKNRVEEIECDQSGDGEERLEFKWMIRKYLSKEVTEERLEGRWEPGR